jgi:CHAD domain-containing protein
MENFLKEHLDSLNDLRDTQVQLAVIRRLRRQFVAAKLFHQFLQLCERRLAREARKDLKRLKTQRLEKLVSAGRKDLRQKLRKLSVAKIRRLLLEPMFRAYDQTWRLHELVRASDPTTIHRTRVAFKRFRYMVETLIACAKIAPAASLVDPMRGYQSCMGAVQDAEMLLQAFQHFVDQDPPPAPDASRFKRALLRRQQVAIRKYMRVRLDLEKFRPRLLSSRARV